MKKYNTYIKTGLLVFLTIIIFGLVSNKNRQRKVNQVTVNLGEQDVYLIEKSTIKKMLKQNGKEIVNQPKSLVNLQTLEKKMLKHPMVESVEISLGIMGDLQVDVKQKKPIARVVEGAKIYYLDANINPMPLSSVGSCRVMILDNDNHQMNFKKVYPLIQAIQKDDFFRDFIVGIKKIRAGYLLTTRIRDHEIMFGAVYKVAEKFKKAKAFYNYAQQNKLLSKYKKINLQYHNQVVCLK